MRALLAVLAAVVLLPGTTACQDTHTTLYSDHSPPSSGTPTATGAQP